MDTDFVREAERAGAEITGELELAYRFGKGKYIAITGTNGKTTTTTLVGEIFKNAGKRQKSSATSVLRSCRKRSTATTILIW
ncbi:MAG: hypothetical protein V8Q39_09100 [Anaerovoracaceae bacterium]